jgi:hypothetical protein
MCGSKTNAIGRTKASAEKRTERNTETKIKSKKVQNALITEFLSSSCRFAMISFTFE